MTILTKRCKITNGVIFVYDPTAIIDVPDDTSSAPVLYTDSCISIWTAMENDGSVNLTLTDELNEISGNAVFDGLIETKGGTVAFIDSNVHALLKLSVRHSLTRLTVFTNHPTYPDVVTCRVRPES